MSEFYEIDSTRVSHREYWWGTKSPLVIIGWILKWLRVRIPSSTDDPNVDSTLPFTTSGLPDTISARFLPLAMEFSALGFHSPIYHVITDPGTRTTVYWATFLHSSGQHFARIHHRVWQQANSSDRGVFALFFTPFADGTFLVSSSGKPDLDTPASVQMNRMYRASCSKLWQAHEQMATALHSQKMPLSIRTPDALLATSEQHHILVRDFHLSRRVFRSRTTTEHASAEAFAASVAQAQQSGLEHAGAIAELERLQTRKPSWANAIWLLVISLIVFLGAGAAQWDWKFTLWLAPALLLHEMGHWIAMRRHLFFLRARSVSGRRSR